MTTTTPSPTQTPIPAAPKPAATEDAIAWATILTPLGASITAPFLADSAAAAAGVAYTAAAAFSFLNYTDRIPTSILEGLPASDILTAYRTPFLISTVTTGMGLGLGILQGTPGMDALLAGALDPLTIPGIVSLGWWAAFAAVPYKLSRILRRGRRRTTTPHTPGAATIRPPATAADDIVRNWGLYISNPNGTHRGQILHTVIATPTHWTGTITAPQGQPVTVTPDTVSSVYQTPTAWITFTEGAHAGEKRITVALTAPAELDPTTLAGAWRKWVARSGGVMAGSHLEDVQTDPNTGGEVAYVVAGETLDKLPLPDRDSLAGALRTNTLLCSYSPEPGDPRRGTIRKMRHNPLKEGVPFPGTHVLKISDGGYVQIGRHVSGFPARIQFVDPKLGAKHLFVAGVTGSGKGGLIQIVALADHVNGHAILYADPKGSSNPDVETMACYSGLGDDGCMGPLRVAYALLRWRIEESARLKMKNFVATPERPWVRLILDEAHVPLSELDQYKKEAAKILEALASKARSQGIILTLVNQAVNADKLGGSTALRTNVIQGGSIVMLRTDSDQRHLITTGFEGVDPGKIPPAWDVKRPLIYDEKQALQDPESTFGLGYTLGPGGAAEMMRDFILESAAPYIDPTAVAYPADWPDWDNRHEIAATSILGDDTTDPDDSDDSGDFAGPVSSLLPLPPKEPTAEEKILTVLEGNTDPVGEEVIYLHKDDIGRQARLPQATLDATLTRLTKKDLIHRKPGSGSAVRGRYGFGPAPSTD
ncbi:type IV secretory system conjugative DNA transfer family protein [Streptomyces longwoodensis]|uniref:type IV secretory system conjugative DNA transfer family protein n=1 Tax=Streptomyces longwoodensis TaxID=68231 RepID=UPI00224F159D|nr:type IV secretory system conjugative DNA transfer family protein [Streptomyces longwoodensis]MCX5001004.1 type IV secretory system conjugative DNA transfer family protein [Streptomyces longwoodensis]